MEVQTSRFGLIKLEENQIINIPRGLIGFRDRSKYALVKPREGSPLVWLQSLEDSNLAFVMTSPFMFVPDYNIKISARLIKALRAEDKSQVELWCLVTIPPGKPQDMTGNLIAPLVINPVKKIGEQLVVEQASYSHKQPLFKD